MFTLSVVDCGFFSGVMVSMFTSSVVDRGFFSGVMVSMFTLSVVDHGFIQGLKLAVAHSPFASKFQCGPLKISS